MEQYVTIDTVEQDGSEHNHLLRMVVRGKEYLISATTSSALGMDGDRLWVTWSYLDCYNVTTLDEAPGQFVTGHVELCTALDVRPI